MFGDYVRVQVRFATECVNEIEAKRAYQKLRVNTAELALEFDESSPEARAARNRVNVNLPEREL